MRKFFVFAVAVALGIFILDGLATAMPTHPTFGTFVNASVVPHGSKLVLNVTYKVKNDEDSGNVGYWALDKYNKSLQVWKAPDGLFYVVAKYAGKWKTFEGALSPGDGVVETDDASGTFEGGYVATFTFSGDFNPGGNKTKGNIGTYDFGGTKEDVLLGTYGAGQTGSPEPFDALELYFPGHQDFTYIHWGWTYHYRNQTWNNFDYGTTGDIVK